MIKPNFFVIIVSKIAMFNSKFQKGLRIILGYFFKKDRNKDHIHDLLYPNSSFWELSNSVKHDFNPIIIVSKIAMFYMNFSKRGLHLGEVFIRFSALQFFNLRHLKFATGTKLVVNNLMLVLMNQYNKKSQGEAEFWSQSVNFCLVNPSRAWIIAVYFASLINIWKNRRGLRSVYLFLVCFPSYRQNKIEDSMIKCLCCYSKHLKI